MKTIIHNQTHKEFSDVSRAVEYFFYNKFKNYSKAKKWELHLWLEEGQDDQSIYRCGAHLIRPGKRNLFVNRVASNITDALRKTSHVVLNNTVKGK